MNFIFDWAGTLNDNFHAFCWVFNQISKELGKELRREDELEGTFEIPYMKFWNRHFPDLTKDHQNKLYRKYIHKAPKPKMFVGVKEVIEFLHEKNCKLFIVSSDLIDTLKPEAKRYGLFDFFTEIVANSYKKDADISKIVKKYDLKCDETFYVGDTSGDIEFGKMAGVKTIGVSWGFQSKERLSKSKPDFLVDDISEIKKILPS